MKKTTRANWFSRYVVPLLWTATFVYTLVYAFDFRHRSINGVIWSDAEGYYMYLPALLINGGFEDLPLNTNTGQFRLFPGTNKVFDKYTYGVAVMQLPFFWGAHLAATQSDQYPADGRSRPYIYAVILAGLFYGFLGLLVLRKVLREQFEGWWPDVVVLSIYLGTNLLHYTAAAPGMSHVFSFFLFALFMWLTHRYYRLQGSWLLAALLALILGWTVLIRPTNILLGFYFLAYAENGQLDLMQRWRFFRDRFWHLLLFAFFGFVVFIPQMLYWHYMTGQYVFYSYRDVGFSYWNAPRLGPVLFSIKNGWLLFSPFMGLALVGAVAGSIRNVYNSRLILLIWLLAWYAFASWGQWWFGGAFGHRAFVEFYALLAFPLAWLAQQLWQAPKRWPRLLFFGLWLLLIYYSLGLTDHYRGPHYEWDSWWAAMEMMFTW